MDVRIGSEDSQTRGTVDTSVAEDAWQVGDPRWRFLIEGRSAGCVTC